MTYNTIICVFYKRDMVNHLSSHKENLVQIFISPRDSDMPVSQLPSLVHTNLLAAEHEQNGETTWNCNAKSEIYHCLR